MNVNLLYPDREWRTEKTYYGWDWIVKDLGLRALFEMAEKGSRGSGRRKIGSAGDPDLSQIMNKVMHVPLTTEEEVLYRQEILQECFVYEGLVQSLFDLASDVLSEWNSLGRKGKSNAGNPDSKAGIMTDINIFSLFVSAMADLKALLSDNAPRLNSKGFKSLCEQVESEFDDETQKVMEGIVKDLDFYVNGSVEMIRKNEFVSNISVISVDCGIADGLKFTEPKLDSIETKRHFFRSHNGVISKINAFVAAVSPNSLTTYGDQELSEDAEAFVKEAVGYVMSVCSSRMYEYGRFFEQLYTQVGFYLGAINIRKWMKNHWITYCFPIVGKKDSLAYEGLKEIVMCEEQGKDPVGNTGNMDGKMLAIITGANQGGKSTFLRSIGIAQVMMQSGLCVPAESYTSGLYPNLFTHFTRREDSQMNSGRLDEELRRMRLIIDHLGENSLILLNESFASTTEKEGSSIMYDIVKAVGESGVRVFAVTHLLSFAQKVYEEMKDKPDSDIAFMSAERLDNGTRTFKILPHKPELTSFGLELYDEIITG